MPDESPNPLDLVDLALRIGRREQAALSEFYEVFNRGMRFYIARVLGPDELDDRVHTCFLTTVSAIQRGELRDAERIMGYARTIVRRTIAGAIDDSIAARNRFVDPECSPAIASEELTPEELASHNEEVNLMLAVLGGMGRRDREILKRFYLDEEAKESICLSMGLDETQFRLLKSRAKSRLGEMGRRALARRRVTSSRGFVRPLPRGGAS